MKKSICNILPIVAILLVSGCASSSPQDDPAYVSPTQYQSFDCRQIHQEMRLVSNKIDVATQTDGTTQVLDAAVSAFAISRGMGVSDGNDNVHLQRLKNEYDVLEQTAIRKKCN